MQATRFHTTNPNLKVNTQVLGTAAAPQVSFTFIDDTTKVYDSQHYTAFEIFFDVHLTLDHIDNQYEMNGKSLDDV